MALSIALSEIQDTPLPPRCVAPFREGFRAGTRMAKEDTWARIREIHEIIARSESPYYGDSPLVKFIVSNMKLEDSALPYALDAELLEAFVSGFATSVKFHWHCRFDTPIRSLLDAISEYSHMRGLLTPPM